MKEHPATAVARERRFGLQRAAGRCTILLEQRRAPDDPEWPADGDRAVRLPA
jgi:hypothetical protein